MMKVFTYVILSLLLCIGTVHASTTYFYAGNTRVAQNEGGQINYLYADRLGSDTQTKALPFGQIIITGDRLGFSGKEQDESGLSYFGARYLDTSLGRFLAIDPVPSEPSYAYVGNNPLTLIDPTGTSMRFPSDAEINDPHNKVWDQWGKYNEETATELKRMDDYFVTDMLNKPFGKELVTLDEDNYLVRTELFDEFTGTPEQMALKQVLTEIIDSDKQYHTIFHSGGLASTIQKNAPSMIGSTEQTQNTKPELIGIALGSPFNEWAGSAEALGGGGSDTQTGTGAAIWFHEAAHLLGAGEGEAVDVGNLARASEGLNLRRYYGRIYRAEGLEKDYWYLYTGYQYDQAKEYTETHPGTPSMDQYLFDQGMYDKVPSPEKTIN